MICHRNIKQRNRTLPSTAQQLASFDANVRLFHQRLPDQDGSGTALRQPLDIGAGVDAALGDQEWRRAVCCMLRVAWGRTQACGKSLSRS